MIDLTLDPGICSGWANGQDAVLTGCGVCSIDNETLPFLWPGLVYDRLTIELPRIYPGPQEEDANDQITLSINHGEWKQRLKHSARAIRTPTAKQWKGSVPKRIHQPRILEALTPKERALIPKLPKTKLHNAVDAVGLFLEAVGRMHGGR